MSTHAPDSPVILPLGLTALIVRFGLKAGPDLTAAVKAFVADLERDPIAGVTEIACSLTTVMVSFDGGSSVRDKTTKALQERLSRRHWTSVASPDPMRRWTIPVAFGEAFGPDLTKAARAACLSEKDAITDLCSQDVDVLTLGFAPGQAYLGFLKDHWNIPRMEAINPSVPAGALILAIRQLIVFTNENPTGWHHVGQSGFLPFSLERAEPILLRAGDALRFTPVPPAEMTSILADNPDGLGQAKLEVLR
ncbi:allophanate hydrolase subunit 1 [Cognatishimia sp.]|uniref:5-oxoprolinase subunit B family protein n=1 Tax=Cognatishimia sp. TaxID=2211648 RepID=UPI0035191F08|nr:carboxyltransferase domain-containing protein [Cognatishimia sp.]